jgi:photosystem II stability/assembly factor-like uncharacterized protein
VWRRRIVAGLVAGLALPAAAHADAPAGFNPIGPPAMLNTIVFAGDGTAYGTVEPGGRPAKVAGSSGSVWRSTDHGHTWSSAYRAPDGAPVALLAASNVNPAVIYATIETAKNAYAAERIDVSSGKAVALPFASFLGEDAAGTAYGITPNRDPSSQPPRTSFLVRCPRASDACDALPVPIAVSDQIVVDPNAVGVFSSTSAGGTDAHLVLSTDGGATWSDGAPLGTACSCYRVFAGPGPGMLYVLGDQLSVSTDSGRTWAAVHPVSPNDALAVGNRPSASLRVFGKTVLYSGDAGATFQSIAFPAPVRSLLIDPTDVTHLVITTGDETLQSWDRGLTWSDVADARFGMVMLAPENTAGAGRRIYAVEASAPGSSSSLWISDDSGATWTNVRRPSDERRFQPVVSRDDPRAAYVFAQETDDKGARRRVELRTGDGGLTWAQVTVPASSGVFAIAPGDAAHVYAYGNGGSTDLWESRDGALTWTPVPLDARCALAIAGDRTSPTGERLWCNGWAIFDPRVSPIARPLPYAEGLFGSPDRAGAFAVATGALLGDVQNDWSFSPLLGPTGIYGPSLPSSSARAAWPAPGGTTFVADDPNRGMTWVRRGTGRWWRLQVSGRDLTFLSLLDATHALVRDTKTDGAPLAVVDLRSPAVDAPQVQELAGKLTCVVPWGSSEAATSRYAWLRDGDVLRGATHAQRPRSRYDRGHALTCRATARNAWGSITLTSSNSFPVPGTAVALPQVRVEDSATVGTHLHCSARKHVTWLRDERLMPHHHARSYTVRANDENHAIRCQTQLADGTLVRSPSTFVTP